MSGGVVPSKSTVYVSNLPFSLTNSDIHKLFESHGKIVKVTVVKSTTTRRSKGIAFVLFLKPKDAVACAAAINNTQIGGRTIKSSIAVDNGRSPEFLRRRDYPDKSKCWECGEEGHLSYTCSNNTLGARSPPPKKLRHRKKKNLASGEQSNMNYYDTDSDDGVRNPRQSDSDDLNNDRQEVDAETLSAAIRSEQEKSELEQYRYKVSIGEYDEPDHLQNVAPRSKRFKKSNYFSDEEELSD